MHKWPNKDPDEVLDYQFDWSLRLADGETISTSQMILEDGTVTIDSATFSGGLTTVWLSGGTVDDVNIITNRVVTSESRTYDESARVRIRHSYRGS